MCRNSNILFSGSMPPEEATLITEKLEISDFITSNGQLEKFKQKYSICNKPVAGEAGDVSKETMESWNRLEPGGTRAMFGTRMRWVAFGVASVEKPQTQRENGALDGKAKQ